MLTPRNHKRSRTSKRRRFTWAAVALGISLWSGLLGNPLLSAASPAIPDAGASATDGAAPTEVPPLRIVVAGTAPFAQVDETGESVGLSVAVWQRVASALDRPYKSRWVDSVDKALEAVVQGQADVAVGPITITATRAEVMAFTFPHYQTSLGILAPGSGGFWHRIRPFVTKGFLTGAAGLLIVLTIVGVLVWLAERRDNPTHFPPQLIGGIGNGIWLALVTMTTVGYGDRVPRSTAGRIVIASWMLMAMILASSMTAFFATALTLSQMPTAAISNARDLHGRRVATMPAGPAARLATAQGARVILVANVELAVNAIKQGEADAAVFDLPMLAHYLKMNPSVDLYISDAHYDTQSYAFALPLSSAILQPINLGLLRLRDDGVLTALGKQWVGTQ